MLQQVIARLYGELGFKVNTTGLERFQAMLSKIDRQMQAVNAKAAQLEKRLNINPRIKAKIEERLGHKPQVKEQQDKSLRQSLDREYKLERAAQQARRDTFRAELESQKLTFANQKAEAAMASAALRDRAAMAVIASKEQKAAQERLKAEGIQQKNAHNVEAAKLRQGRLEKLLQQQQSRTYILQQKALQSLTATQKAELVLQHVRERGQRAIEQHQARQAAATAREQRQQVRAAQQLERHEWSRARQQVWAATQARKQQQQGNVVFDMAPMLGKFGVAAAAIGSAVAGLTLVVNRLQSVQERVSGNEQYANTLEQAGGSNPVNQKLAKDEFIRISDKYGTSADIEAAKSFRTFVMSQTAGGKMGLQDAIKRFETQQAAFRGAGMNRQEQQRASLQLQQVRAKTKGDAEDVQTFAEAGPLLIEPIKQAWAERNKFKGTAQQLDKAFRESTKKGNLLAVDFDKGLERFVKNNQPSIDKQSQSIEAAQTRLDNEKLLQQFGIDQSPQLKAAINDRIKAERDLNESMKPLRESIMRWDTALQSSTAKMLNFYFKTPEIAELKKRVTAAEARVEKVKSFSPRHPARVIAEDDLRKAQQDLIDAKVKAGDIGPSTPVPKYLRVNVDAGKQGKSDSKPLVMPESKTIMDRIESLSKPLLTLPAPKWLENLTLPQPSPLILPPVPTTNNTTQNINLGGVHVTVQGDVKDPDAVAASFEKVVDRKIDRLFDGVRTGVSETE